MSSVQTVTERAAVRLLSHGRSRWVLGEFLRGENSVAAVARTLGLDLRRVHRDVQALLGTGLLKLVREQARSGRAIRIYAASAPAFFVPFSVTDAADLTDLDGRRRQGFDDLFDLQVRQQFSALHHAQSAGRAWGVRLYLDPDRQVQVDMAYEGAALVSPAQQYQGPTGLMLDLRTDLHLSGAEAQQVQVELIQLLGRLRRADTAHRTAGSGRPFLLRLGLVGLADEDAATQP